MIAGDEKIVLESKRLLLSELRDSDAGFIKQLVNEPGWLRFIGDRGVRTLDDARHYIRNGPAASYRQRGFGLYKTALKDNGEPIGLCGLLKRDFLADVDIGFAFLEAFAGQGYAHEAARAVMEQARESGIERVVAITDADNYRSIKLLEKLGLRFDKMIEFPGEDGQVGLFVPSD